MPANAAATSTTRTSAIRWTSCCGSRRPTTSRAGTRCGAPAGRAGTSSAARSALRELGTTIDLHGGGSDLIFPHHECERAQSEAATGEPFVKHWMHTSMVFMDGQKMSKSLGNLVFVDKLRTEWDPRAIRLAIIDNHYRRDWEWHDSLMPRNTERLRSWKDASGGPTDVGLVDDVRAALDDDLDTIGALAAIDGAAAAGRDVGGAAALLGVEL